MTDPHKADPRLRSRLIIILLVSGVIFIILDSFDLLSFDNILQGLSDQERIQRIQLILSILFWPLIPLGLYLVYFGYRIIATGRFPPSGSRVIKTVEIETGKSAVARGWVAIATGLSLCGLAVYGAVVIPAELGRLL